LVVVDPFVLAPAVTVTTIPFAERIGAGGEGIDPEIVTPPEILIGNGAGNVIL